MFESILEGHGTTLTKWCQQGFLSLSAVPGLTVLTYKVLQCYTLGDERGILCEDQ